MSRIEVTFRSGVRHGVEAVVMGLLAAHLADECLVGDGEGGLRLDPAGPVVPPAWVLTHVPTGLRLGGWLFDNESDALVVMAELQPIRWDLLSEHSSRGTVSEYGRLVEQTIKRLVRDGLIAKPVDKD